jgi:hypothetical protein
MNDTITYIFIIVIILIVVLLYFSFADHGMVYVVSDLDNESYLVRDLPDKQIAVNILAKIRRNMNKISSKLYETKNSHNSHKEHIEQLHNGLKNCIIAESSGNDVYTSYSINKGEQIIFCLRSKLIKNNLHDFNLIMYVVLHEMSHVACPEVGHTELFKKIFAFIANEAVNMGLYSKIDFRSSNKEYCGMQITDSII